MVYVVADGENVEKVLLVKADNENDLKERLKLKPSQRVTAAFTSEEFGALHSASFAVISG